MHLTVTAGRSQPAALQLPGLSALLRRPARRGLVVSVPDRLRVEVRAGSVVSFSLQSPARQSPVASRPVASRTDNPRDPQSRVPNPDCTRAPSPESSKPESGVPNPANTSPEPREYTVPSRPRACCCIQHISAGTLPTGGMRGMELSRREIVRGAVAAAGAAMLSSVGTCGAGAAARAGRTRPANEPFGYCLNTSTIRGNNLDIVARRQRRVEGGLPRDRAVDHGDRRLHRQAAARSKDLGKRIADAGLTVEDAIAFNSFLDDDDTRRAASMEKLKVDMDKVAQIGGKRIAAPPGNNRAAVSLDNAAEVLPRGARDGREDGRAAAARAVGHAPGARAAVARHLRDASRPDAPTPASCSTCSTSTRAGRRSRR